MQGGVERDKLVMSILIRARRQAPEQRENYVRFACGTDTELYREISEALEWDARMGSFIEKPFVEGAEVRPFQVGDVVLDRFEVVGEVGEGGMSFVYEAIDRRRKQRIAIKAAKKGFQTLLSPELEGALTVRHRNVCLVNEIHTAQTRYGEVDFLTMEFLDGETLSSRLAQQGRLSPDEARDIALQICAGLAEAHRSGVIHRDLKSANIMLCEEPDGSCRTVIMDFGLASGRSFSSPEDGGTPGYLAPEVLRGEKASKESDIYALGVVLYEMIIGHRPLEPLMSEDHESAGAAAPTSLIDGLDPRWDAAVLPCLAPAPEDRPTDAALVAECLKKSRGLRKFAIGSGLALAILGLLALTIIEVPPLRVKAHKVLEQVGLVKPPPTGSTVVLADFTGDPKFAETLGAALAIQLEQSPFVRLLADQKVRETLKLMDRPATQPLTEDVAREICLRTGANAVLQGAVDAVGQHYLLTVKAVDCQTDETLAAASSEAVSKEKLPEAVNTVSSQLREKLGESRESRDRFNQPLEQATTSSLDALQAYTEGRKRQLQGGDPEAIPYYTRALELDPQFALAYAVLADAYDEMGESMLAARNYKKAYELRGRASQRERFHIEGTYLANSTGEIGKAVHVYEEWTRTYPNDWSPHQSLSYLYAVLGEYDQSAEEAQTAIRLAPNNAFPYTTVMFASNARNLPRQAIEAYQNAKLHKLENPYLEYYRYFSAFLRNDAATMRREVDDAKGKFGTEDLLLSAEADNEGYHGHFRGERQLTAQAVQAAIAAGQPETAAEWKANAALREAEVGNAAAAASMSKEALKLSLGKLPETITAMALARAGEVAAAQKLVDRLDRQFPLDTMMQGYCLPSIRAAIEISKKHPTRAIELLEAASQYEMGATDLGNLYPAYVRGLAYLQAEDGPRAVAEFRKSVDHPGVMLNSINGALVYLHQGRAQKMSGDMEGARASYGKFLELWKDADTEIPLLRQAMSEYLQLQKALARPVQ